MATKAKSNRRTEHKFSQIPSTTIPRSQFDRSHSHKTTFDAGWLVPIYVDEVLPGDTFNLNMSLFARLATPIFPIMDNMVLDVFFFFVPYRLVWDNWQKFCGEQDDPGDSIAFTIPQNFWSGTLSTDAVLWDYMGIPLAKTNTTVSALPFRSYHLIWNEWFRDQNLQDKVVFDTDDGPDTTGYRYLFRRGKRHDYFTSCLPWPQKQTLPVTLPLGTTAPVERILATSPIGIEADVSASPVQGTMGNTANNAELLIAGAEANDTLQWGTDVGLQANLATATAATINSLRESFQIQRLLERDARGGTRYVELLKSHFGITNHPDARLQRPEYLGGGTTQLIVHPIAQTIPRTTASGWDDAEKGSLSGFATAAASGIGFNKSFVEHGTIIGLISARADLTYQQGLHRMWSRSTRYDFYWPAFANLGEQAVLNKEIFFQNHDAGGAAPNDDNSAVFGYQERWAEYRYMPSRISGVFKSDHATPLDAWHLSQEFGSLPVLGDTFIQDNPPVARVIAVTTEPHFIFDSYFKIKCARPMPVYSVPGMIDHF